MKAYQLFPVVLLLSTLNSQLSTCFAQGSLTPPPGVPAPTMLTLNQIEPRTPVDAIHTPGDAGDLYIISQPGSYYLTTNITSVGSKEGIEISANNVALDLNGFALQGASGIVAGIYIPDASANITVRNGSLSGWINGVDNVSSSSVDIVYECLNISGCGTGILAQGPCVVRDCNCQNNSSEGIVCEASALISGCTVNYNNTGIQCDSTPAVAITGCTIDNNSDIGMELYGSGGVTVAGCKINNNANGGIYASGGGLVAITGCTADNNGGDGIGSDSGQPLAITGCTADNNVVAGMACLGVMTVTGCMANNNTSGIILYASGAVSGCTVENNTTYGINVTSGLVSGCTVLNTGNGRGIYLSPGTASGCYVSGNFDSGIYVAAAGSEVIGNTCIGNNRSDSGSDGGIFIDASNNRVEDNHVTASGNTGIAVASIPSGFTNNVIIKNSVSGNGANNYSAPAGNDLGPVGTAAMATSPWANISH